MIHGGQCFVALSEGLQNALAACGGASRDLRTNRLLTASRNRDGINVFDITPLHQALCAHYGLNRSRNNREVPHENGIVEAPHGHLQRRLPQKLVLRVSRVNPLGLSASIKLAGEGIYPPPGSRR